MRPKFLSLLAVTALVLTGCASAETTNPATNSTESPAPADSPQTAAHTEGVPVPDEVFLEAVHEDLDKHAEYFETAVPKDALSDDALLERGRDICDQLEAGTLPAGPKTDDMGLAELEILVRTPASVHLCDFS